jgi:hypothetical protein
MRVNMLTEIAVHVTQVSQITQRQLAFSKAGVCLIDDADKGVAE